MRKTLLTSAAVLGLALCLPAFAQTATDPNPANPSAVKDGTPAAGTGSGAAPGMDPATAGKTGASMGNQAPSQGPGPMGQQNGPADSNASAPASGTGMASPGAAPSETAPSDEGASTPARPRHRSMSSNGGMGDGHWAHQPGTGESGPASNQASNIDSADTRGVIAPHFPAPKLGANAGPDGYLRAADRALAAHKTGAAQQALEMAETRLLDRSTAPDSASQPDQNPRIAAVTAARKALASKDWQGARKSIQEAMNSPGGMGSEGSQANDNGVASGNAMPSGASSGQMQNGMSSTSTSTTQGVASGNPGATPAPMDPAGSNPTSGAAGSNSPGAATAPNQMAPGNGAK